MTEFPAKLPLLEAILGWARAQAPDWVTSDVVELGLVELVTNAIVHGSAEADGEDPSPDATIALEVVRGEDRCAFQVAWSVRSCPEAERTGREVDVWAERGRGLFIAEHLFDRIAFASDGLSVTAEISRPEAVST